tara:strand:- start:1753 stop:1974 length:222 start_codon:yes stop_codon:yes gene_type:complete
VVIDINKGALLMNISAELQSWLDTRENLLRFKKKLYDDGGHVMLRTSAYSPEELDEPLRSEAMAYFEFKQMTS